MSKIDLDTDTKKLAEALFFIQSKPRKVCIDAMNIFFNYSLVQALKNKNFDFLYKILRSLDKEKSHFLMHKIRLQTPLTFDKQGKIKFKKNFNLGDDFTLVELNPFSDVILDFDERSDIFKLDRKTIGVDEMYHLIVDGLVLCRNKFNTDQLNEISFILNKVTSSQ